jgi:hypothetical protein
MIASKPFASGHNRDVYDVKGRPEVIVKKLRNPLLNSNYLEWIVWHAIQDTSLADLFGSCFLISATRRYLMMERLENISEEQYRPAFPE